MLQELLPGSRRTTGLHAHPFVVGGGLEKVAASQRDQGVHNTAFRAILHEMADRFFDTGAGLPITEDGLRTVVRWGISQIAALYRLGGR